MELIITIIAIVGMIAAFVGVVYFDMRLKVLKAAKEEFENDKFDVSKQRHGIVTNKKEKKVEDDQVMISSYHI